jgi:hypothetical protein
MDAAGICVRVQIPKCVQSTDELQGDVYAPVHHPAFQHGVSTLPKMYGVFMSAQLCGGQ